MSEIDINSLNEKVKKLQVNIDKAFDLHKQYVGILENIDSPNEKIDTLNGSFRSLSEIIIPTWLKNMEAEQCASPESYHLAEEIRTLQIRGKALLDTSETYTAIHPISEGPGGVTFQECCDALRDLITPEYQDLASSLELLAKTQPAETDPGNYVPLTRKFVLRIADDEDDLPPVSKKKSGPRPPQPPHGKGA